MSTLAEIKARITNEIFRPDLAAEVAQYIKRAIAHYDQTRFWFNQGTQTAAIVAGNSFLTLPTGAQHVEEAYVGTRSLAFREADELQDWISAGPISGQVSDYTRIGDQLRLYPTPNANDTATLFGWFSLAPLTDGESNGWTTDGEDVIVARTKLMICRAITLDETRAAVARIELYGDPQDRRDIGCEGALFAKNARLISGSTPAVKAHY